MARRRRKPAVSEYAWAIMTDAPLPAGRRFEKYRLRDRLPALWREHAAQILPAWIEAKPGTRPSCWWRFDAPENRRRLGGIGDPLHEASAYAPDHHLGIPTDWVLPDGPHADRGAPVDPADPPIFESQAAFLDRHGLLEPGERNRLPEDALEPEPLDVQPLVAEEAA